LGKEILKPLKLPHASKHRDHEDEKQPIFDLKRIKEQITIKKIAPGSQ
jgi:hypothetical protein